MSVVAFSIVAFMLTAYVLLDGYDLGVGAITPFVTRSDRQREASIQSIGAFWNGNEVWLIAAGGALFALFPRAYADAFSGLYLPLMFAVWLLIARGLSIEMRSHIPTEIWHSFWDFCFASASTLLIVILGVAMGNLLRGLPLGVNGRFQGTLTYLLNPYALLVGILALVALAQHGATFLTMRVEGPPATRARSLIAVLVTGTLVLYVAVTITTWLARGVTLTVTPLTTLALLGTVSLIAVQIYNARGSGRDAFIASSVFLATLMIEAAGTMFPYLLRALPPERGGLSIYDASPSPPALASALAVTIVGILAVLIYGARILRLLAGRVYVDDGNA